MKFSFSSKFTRTTLYLFINIIILSVVGNVVSLAGVSLTCNGWLLCEPITLFDWLKIVHIILVAISAALMLWLFIKAWREHREDSKLLPLVTVTTILFFGQAFVGAIQVIRGFPLHLVILHALTALLLWISLISLVITSGFLVQDGTEYVKIDIRQKIKDFFVLCKPLIVALLLLTTLGGLVVGGKGWPTPILAFWTMLGGALAAGGSSALNQYIDRELDKNMQRTSNRPLAAGRMTAPEGLSFGLALCLVSYYILAGFVNLTAALLSLAGIFYYVIFYSILLKKATVQNIVIGGGAGSSSDGGLGSCNRTS